MLKKVHDDFGAGVGRDGLGRGDADRASKRMRMPDPVSRWGREYLALREWTFIDVFRSKKLMNADRCTPWRMQVLKDDRWIVIRTCGLRKARRWGRLETRCGIEVAGGAVNCISCISVRVLTK